MGAARAGTLAPLPRGGSKNKFASEKLEEEVAKKPDATLTEFDENGINHRLHRLFACAPRGKKVYTDIPGER